MTATVRKGCRFARDSVYAFGVWGGSCIALSVVVDSGEVTLVSIPA